MGRGQQQSGATATAALRSNSFALGARVLINGGLDDIPDGTYGTVKLTPGQNDSVHYVVRCQDAEGSWHNVSLHPSVLVAAE